MPATSTARAKPLRSGRPEGGGRWARGSVGCYTPTLQPLAGCGLAAVARGVATARCQQSPSGHQPTSQQPETRGHLACASHSMHPFAGTQHMNAYNRPDDLQPAAIQRQGGPLPGLRQAQHAPRWPAPAGRRPAHPHAAAAPSASPGPACRGGMHVQRRRSAASPVSSQACARLAADREWLFSFPALHLGLGGAAAIHSCVQACRCLHPPPGRPSRNIRTPPGCQC